MRRSIVNSDEITHTTHEKKKETKRRYNRTATYVVVNTSGPMNVVNHLYVEHYLYQIDRP